MMLSLYKTLTTLAGPPIRLYLARRKALGKEDPIRFNERLGRAGGERPDGPLVWIHAASVGESLSMLPLVERLLAAKPNLGVMMTTGTVTSAKLMAERLPEGAFHQYVPVDRQGYVRRFLDHWRPDLALWAESEFWPNLISETSARGVPMVLINGRVSSRSHIGWQRYKGLIADLLSGFDLCLGQTEEDAWRLLSLGAQSAKCLGNLKFAAPPLPADADQLDVLDKTMGERPRWLAASTHAGEEEIIAGAHRKLRRQHPGVLTIIVPRHPARGANIAGLLRADDLNVALRSASDNIVEDTDIYIADTMGELGLFFRLADVVLMGKSLLPLGGQNPLEAARLDCAILLGPHMANFEEIASRLREAGGAKQVADGEELAAAVAELLGDEAGRARLTSAAKAFAGAEAGVMDAVMAALQPYLDNLPMEGDSRARA